MSDDDYRTRIAAIESEANQRLDLARGQALERYVVDDHTRFLARMFPGIADRLVAAERTRIAAWMAIETDNVEAEYYAQELYRA